MTFAFPEVLPRSPRFFRADQPADTPGGDNARAKMFFAALWSRSMTEPHAAQV